MKAVNRSSRPPNRRAGRGGVAPERLESRLCMSYYTQSVPTNTILPSDAAAGDQFGRSMAVLGTDVVAGSMVHTVSAKTYAGQGWRLHTDSTIVNTYTRNPVKASEYNGVSVAASGSDVVMGAYMATDGATNSGSATLFSGSTGLPTVVYHPSNASSNGMFGTSIAAQGNYVLVGAPMDNTMGTQAGAAYLYDKSSGNILAKYYEPTAYTSARFGSTVAFLDNGNVVIGCPYDGRGAASAGSVYIMSGSATGTVRTALYTLQKSTPVSGENFGKSLATYGNNLLIGAPMEMVGSTYYGGVYLYDGSTGTQLKHIVDAAPVANEQFGLSVALSSDGRALVGAPFRTYSGATNAGGAMIFSTSTGNMTHLFLEPTAASSDQFGACVAFSGQNAVISDPYRKVGTGASTGGVYVFTPSNTAPVANAGSNQSANDNTNVTVSGAASTDADGADDIVTYAWDLNNSGVFNTTGSTVTFTKSAPGTYPIKLKVTDRAGATSTSTVNVTFSDVAPVVNSGVNITVDAGVAAAFSGSAISPVGSGLATYEWNFNYNGTFAADASGTTASKVYTTPGSYTAALKVTDIFGLSTIATLTVTVNAPTAGLSGPSTGSVGTAYSFAGSWSSAASVSWAFSDGGSVGWHSASDPNSNLANYTFTSAGTYTITFSIDNGFGLVTTASTTIVIS